MALYVCSECGYGSASWLGKCPSCSNWDTLVKEERESKADGKKSVKKAEFVSLGNVGTLSSKRVQTGIHEFDRVTGGGFVGGEVILIAGEPGVGKSTLLLKLLSKLKTMYISGEESGDQVKQRAERLKVDLSKLYFSSETQIESLLKTLKSNKKDFDIVVVDSIQTVYSLGVGSTMGSVTQIKESANKLVEFAKSSGKVMIIVGHVTKGGDIAGPKTLEHLVDCVLYLEGEKQSHFRLLRAQKNRFGPTDEVGIFEMKSTGLDEVDKPTAFIDSAHKAAPGRSLVAAVEGSRALFYEIQSLVVPTVLSIPRRVVSGVDYNRLQLLLAVIRKHMNLSLDTYDIYVNVVGGLSAKSPAADLGIVASVVSSAKNTPLADKTAFIGEIGLLGEVRSVFGEEKVMRDAKRFGLKKVYSAKDITSVKLLRKHLM